MPDSAPRLPPSGSAYDLLVVGGGITGAGIARDASLRGLRVILIEKDDFASGTSSRSSRLIHGGLRYLEHGQLKLVFEASAERRRLLRLAPHLVRPLRFVWPVYAGARVPFWKVAAGVTLYDALALFRNVHRHRTLSARGVLRKEPGLTGEALRGGVMYYDAATDDARLTLANVLDAQRAGALVLNHAAITGFVIERGLVTGAQVIDRLTGETAELRARAVVNATGPWSDEVRRMEGAAHRPRVRGSKGTHILVPHARVGNHAALTLLSPVDGRVMFALPAGRFTVFGTTDTFTDASPDQVRPSEDDVAYLLRAANTFFPSSELARGDVISAWAGIRPLVATTADSPNAASREHAIEITPAGVVTITGGKLTTYRIMAQQVVNVVCRRIGAGRTSITAHAPLPDDTPARDAACAADARAAQLIIPGLEWRWGELAWAARSAHAATLADLLIRRTKLAFETPDHGLGVAGAVAEYVAPLLRWEGAAVRAAVDAYGAEVDRIFGVDAGAGV
ncbi:MAG: glycerol-3-phosphate dehydrogenase/oxidase [Gemmatimonadota bacterium]|nr:glycerol-3-phosphate dehydrogenase/oxidase [Gemmatimonadota bacterium]